MDRGASDLWILLGVIAVVFVTLWALGVIVIR